MAIYHLSMKPIARGSGRSAVSAAAYRSGTKLTNERDGLVHDYTRKGGIEHSEIVLPEGTDAEWAYDRSALWNAAEASEKRKDARVAREFEVALPHELTADERVSLTKAFAQSLSNRFGTAVDFAIHAPDGDMDVRNHHAHILMTTRQVSEHGLGDKTLLERENRWLQDNDLPTSLMQLKALRLEWEEMANDHLARAGHDIRLDHRSHSDRGLSIEPTRHVGVHASQIEQRGGEVERVRLEREAARKNADRIRQNPSEVLTLITGEKSVFSKHDIARTLHRYINNEPTEYQGLLTKIMASDALVQLTDGKDGQSARYSTKEMIDTEVGMVRSAANMARRRNHGVDGSKVQTAIDHQDEAIRQSVRMSLPEGLSLDEQAKRLKSARLSDEQRRAVEHVTGSAQMAVVVGYAGAGKSTMLAAAREAWEAQGYSVHGAALAGKAAEGLEESSGIQSRTLASWDMQWQMGKCELTHKEVLVIDEAGMIGSKQLARFISEADEKGAKVVLVGDHEQLQAIGAGAAFRAVAEEVGFVSLEEVRRQRADWQKEASVAFASQRTAEGLEAYESRGHVHLLNDQDQARQHIVQDYMADIDANPNGTRAVMAHRRSDVRQLNIDIRKALQKNGHLPDAERRLGSAGVIATVPGLLDDARTPEVDYQTNDGVRSFVAGDRIVFLQNDKELGVKNGMLGTVELVGEGRLVAKLDGKAQPVQIDTGAYKAFDHGYATTIHKTQGATVDRAFVLASDSMDRHMTYVAMTRHRAEARLYAGQDQFEDMEALKGRLGRSGAKESVLDYVDANSPAFAARRGIEADRQLIEKNADITSTEQPSSQMLRQRFEAALDAYAIAGTELAEARQSNKPLKAELVAAMQKAGATMDEIRPGSQDLLLRAMKNDRKTAQAMRDSRGSERVRRVIYGMAKEEQRLKVMHRQFSHEHKNERMVEVVQRGVDTGTRAEEFGR